MNKEIWTVTIKGSESVHVYDDDAKAWRNAKRIASAYDEIDYDNSTPLSDFVNSGYAWFLTKEGRTISVIKDVMNPSFRGIGE